MKTSQIRVSIQRKTRMTFQVHHRVHRLNAFTIIIAIEKKLLNSLNKDESQEDSVENDSDLDFALGNFKNHHDEDILYQLLKSIYELCIEVPVE